MLFFQTRVLDKVPAQVADLPDWNYDGSSTAQAPGHDSEVIIKPCAMFRDPFRGGHNILVMCSTYRPDGTPLNGLSSTGGVGGNNNRAVAEEVFNNPAVKEQAPWFGLEQEYTLFYQDKITPLGWPKNGFPGPQGPYYCSVGVDNAFGRDISDAHLKTCLFAGVTISGTNGEVMPGQWEYQIGPCEGIAIGDHMWVARYLMQRICERFGVYCSFHPKPLLGDWNGAGCHHNYSTKDMRDPKLDYGYTPSQGPYEGKALKGGFAKIIEAIEKLGAPGRPQEHIAIYGADNELRLTGKHETADMNTFTYGVANRGASIRIPRETEAKGYGYFEDRRPASNIDPYLTSAKMAETTILC